MSSAGDSDRTIKLKIWINREPGDVFRALTEPDILTSWLVPSIEPVPARDGTYLFQWPHNSFEVTFLEVVTDRTVIMSWFRENGVGPEVRFEVEPTRGGSMVRLIHSGFKSNPEYLDTFCGHIEGWTMYLCNLKCRLDYGQDMRADQPPGTIAM